ncbi:MAG: RNA polymerase sigma factor [Cytophagales bacterium]
MEQQKRNFIRTIEANHGTIKSLCRAYYPSAEDQKDAFQDVVLQLWKSFESFRGESEIGTWIYRVSLNTLITKIRKERRAIATESIGPSEESISIVGTDSEIELLHIVIQSLKELDKAIVILFLEGYRNKEISQILNLTATNVSTRLNRVREELKAKFKSLPHELKQP